MAVSPALFKADGQDEKRKPKTYHTLQKPAPALSLAEQLDQQERAKYVKGRFYSLTIWNAANCGAGKKIGSGTYADVFEAHLVSDSSRLVAIKKIKVGPEVQEWGITHDSLREIKFLQELSHPNIIRLHSVFSTKNQNLNLVLEHLPQGDLEKLIKDEQVYYGPSDIKAWMSMFCRAVWFCHENFVLHRDIKPNNLLIAANGEIKLADFGLARSFADPGNLMTHKVITLWYRPPELFYKASYYSGAVDIWSVGCVFAELIMRRPFLVPASESDIAMIGVICKNVGTPTDENWPGVSRLPAYVPVAKEEATPEKTKDEWLASFPAVGEVGVDLLMKMFALDPRKRLTARQILQHGYWTAEPRPSNLEDLPKKGGACSPWAKS
ncbi:TFIIH complex serine/threonine-protein kinase subunit kin28 [Taxawa tesnikishii (nom. ined.)]|nr:TFIIH complex serine/threonine-protein kinase subunit kin28 [Dothideales sp. JES 119]